MKSKVGIPREQGHRLQPLVIPCVTDATTQIITQPSAVLLEVIATSKLNLGHVRTASIIGVDDSVCKIILVIVAGHGSGCCNMFKAENNVVEIVISKAIVAAITTTIREEVNDHCRPVVPGVNDTITNIPDIFYFNC